MRRSMKPTLAVLSIGAMLLTTACTAGNSSSAPSKTGEATTVELWTWNPDAAESPEWISAFQADHPEITLKYRFVQYSDYVNTLRLGLTSESGPDVFALQTGAMATQFGPLATDLTEYLSRTIGSDWKDRFLAADQLNIDGSQIGLPWMVTGAGTIEVNKTLLDQVGATIPTNLSEWKDTCAKLAAAGKKCLVAGAKDAWQNIDVFQALANQSAPGYFYSAIKGEKSFNTPEMVSAFQAWKTLFNEGVIQEGALGVNAYPDAADMFRKGEAGMIAFGSWQNSDMTKARTAAYAKEYGMNDISTFEFRIVPFPNVVQPQGKAELKMFGGPDVAWAVSAKAKNQEAAQTVVQWLASSETSQKKIATTLQQPADKKYAVDTSDVMTDEQKKLVESQAPALAKLIGPRQIENADVQTALGDALSGVASGSVTPEQAAANVQSAIAGR